MHDRWEAQLPFYLAGTLEAEAHMAVEQHLRECDACSATLAEWQRLAEGVRMEAERRMVALPPLSPVVRANLHHPPTLSRAATSTVQLVWAQRSMLHPLLPGIVGVLLVGVLASLGLMSAMTVALPLVALVPLVAALPVAFLHSRELDPAFEMVSATPTEPGALLLARLTFVLALISSVMLPGSLLVSGMRGSAFGPLVASWLGPLLLLSALATVLALRWRPMVAASAIVSGWAAVLLLLWLELSGLGGLTLSLRPLLQPSVSLFAGQLLVAGALWAMAWRALPSVFSEESLI